MGTIPSLDGWRAVAISLVLVSHAGLEKLIPGGLGVTVFFFLSGYLITTLLREEYAAHGRIAIGRFYLRRVLRLYPPLLITMIIAYGLVWLGVAKGGVSLRGFLAQLFYFANFYSLFFDPGATTPAGTGVFWSLAVEEHFYLLFPFLFACLYREDGPKRLIVVLSLVCVAALAWRGYLVGAAHAAQERTYYASDTRIDSIVYGCLLALAKNPLRQSARGERPSAKALALIAASLALLAFTIVYRKADFRETLRYSLQGAALAPLFHYSIQRPRMAVFKPLNHPWVRRLGVYSYSIYLIHFILMENLREATVHPALAMVFCVAVAVAYAWIMDRWVDQPLRQVRARFR